MEAKEGKIDDMNLQHEWKVFITELHTGRGRNVKGRKNSFEGQ